MSQKKYAKTLREAKKLYEERTGKDFDKVNTFSGVTIYKLKSPTPTRKYFVGTHLEWLNK